MGLVLCMQGWTHPKNTSCPVPGWQVLVASGHTAQISPVLGSPGVVPVCSRLQAVEAKGSDEKPRTPRILDKPQNRVADAYGCLHCCCCSCCCCWLCDTAGSRPNCCCNSRPGCLQDWQPEQHAWAVGVCNHGQLEGQQDCVAEAHRCLGWQQVDAPAAAKARPMSVTPISTTAAHTGSRLRRCKPPRHKPVQCP